MLISTLQFCSKGSVNSCVPKASVHSDYWKHLSSPAHWLLRGPKEGTLSFLSTESQDGIGLFKHENISVMHLKACFTPQGNWCKGINIFCNYLCPNGCSFPHRSRGWQWTAAPNVRSGKAGRWLCGPQPPLSWQLLCWSWASANVWVPALSETGLRCQAPVFGEIGFSPVGVSISFWP